MAVIYKCYFGLASKQKILQGNYGQSHTFHPIKGVPYQKIGGYIECLFEEQIKNIT